MRVTEVMRGNPVCCVPETNAKKAAALMRQFNTGVLVVVDDPHRRKVLGIVTDRDLCIKVLAGTGDPEKTTIQDCMTRNPVTCTAQQEIEPVLASMATHKIRRVPVVNEANEVEGIVTDRDLLENTGIPPEALCIALGRMISSTSKSMDVEWGASFP
jgi:CBS domain-containing protein